MNGVVLFLLLAALMTASIPGKAALSSLDGAKPQMEDEPLQEIQFEPLMEFECA